MASMYSCTITAWNDPAIAALNPGVACAPPLRRRTCEPRLYA